jgi:glycosyltransferase involved in cell wall biosynthesis
MVDLSVVIPVYNGAALLPRCLDAIVAQQTHYEMEVWLVDDGSTDETVALYRERYLNAENPLWQSRLQFHLLQQQNAGPSKARNWGMTQAQGRYVALLDADDYWEPDYVEQTVSFLEQHADCVAASSVEFFGGLEADGLGNTRDHNVCTSSGEQLSGCLADAGAATHDDRGLASHNLIRLDSKPISHVKLPFLMVLIDAGWLPHQFTKAIIAHSNELLFGVLTIEKTYT